VGGIALAWIVYDILCRTVGQRSQAALAVIGIGFVALAAWGAGELFTARAAYLQIGVMLGTIMAANVFFVIIPAHRKLVTAMEEGREPDPAPLLEAKNRSVHNNYLTLPVLFTMLAGHFAFVFGADAAWLVFVVIAVLTALIRVFFNRWHAGRRAWWIPAVAVVGVIALALWLQPEEAGSDVSEPVAFTQVAPVVAVRCATCHSGVSAPLGVRLETQEQIEARIDDIERQAVLTRAMPPGNATGLSDEERELLEACIATSRKGRPELEILVGGFSFSARFEEAAAPETVAAFRRMLPLESKIIQVRWSGEGGWIPMGELDVGIGPENATSYPSPGELIFYPGGVSETELLLAYGYVAFASKAGALAGNHFATVVSGSENLRELGRRMLWEGAQDISFSES
jgi:mono/diheme cytochrome c family protein